MRCSRTVPGINSRPKKCTKPKGSAAAAPPSKINYFMVGATLDRDPIPVSAGGLAALAAQQPEPPKTFDWREQNGLANQFNSNLIAQGVCGSCWAIAASTALGDRYAVSLQNMGYKIKKAITGSPVELLSCSCAAGGLPSSQICSGGNIQAAANFMVNNPLKITTNACFPYPQNLMNDPGGGGAEFGGGATPMISWKPNEMGNGGLGCMSNVQGCASGLDCSEANIKLGIQKGSIFTWPSTSGITALKREILEYGPVTTSFAVPDTFIDWWKTGKANDVFRGKPGTLGHAVVIVGWTKDAWIVRNSWGKSHDNSWYFLCHLNNNLGIGLGFSPQQGGSLSFMPSIDDNLINALIDNG